MPMYAVPHHHGQEVIAYIGLVAVNILADKMTTKETIKQNVQYYTSTIDINDLT